MNTVLLFIITIPALEIFLMIKIGQNIGALNTIGLIFLTAVIGIYFARLEGLNTLRSGINNLYKNNLEEEELKKLFIMPKSINWENLAKGYQVPIKNVSDLNKLREAFESSLSMQKSVIIKVDINVENEMKGRNLILKKILTS